LFSMRTFTLLSLLAFFSIVGPSQPAPVDVYAGDFMDIENKPLAGFTVLYEETQTNYTLDDKGYLHLDLPVGTNCTFTLLEQKNYAETQTGTATVPTEGFSGRFNEIVLQVPNKETYALLDLVLPHKRNFSQCQVVVTVCNFQKSFYNCPQGFPGVKASISPPLNQFLYFFGTWGFLSNITNPLPNDLTSTSWDGGVFFMNVDMDVTHEFVVSAEFGDVPFTKTRIKCLKRGRLVNAAPNQGPRAQKPLTDLPCPDNC